MGVFVDNETIKFTGVSGDEIGAFTVVDGGITPAKVSFGFAGSNIKSGAANSVSGYISGGIGFDDFVWSGDEKLTLNLVLILRTYILVLLQIIKNLQTRWQKTTKKQKLMFNN